jgi:hypothetical protein
LDQLGEIGAGQRRREEFEVDGIGHHLLDPGNANRIAY